MCKQKCEEKTPANVVSICGWGSVAFCRNITVLEYYYLHQQTSCNRTDESVEIPLTSESMQTEQQRFTHLLMILQYAFYN